MTKIENISAELSKVPPQALDLEEALLGGLMIEDRLIDRVIAIIQPDMFYKESHRIVFEAICSLSKQHNPTDTLAVSNELKRLGRLDQIGGTYFLTQLTDKVASGAGWEYWAAVILQKYIARKLISSSQSTQDRAFDESEDVFDVVVSAQHELQELMRTVSGSHRRSLLDIIEDALKPEDPNEMLPTPIGQLNSILKTKKDNLIVIAGRPSMGKTAFALAWTRSICEYGKKVAYFSLEMGDVELVDRLIHSYDKDVDGAGQISRFDLEIDDRGGIGVDYIKAAVLGMDGLSAIFIDYLQLMKLPYGDSRDERVGAATRELKALAKELGVPIIILCQLNRAIEIRGGARHKLSDLRESGNIEQDADKVIFITQPIKLGITEDSSGIDTTNMLLLQIAKNRQNFVPTDPIKARINDRCTWFYDWDDHFFN
jgi:replicative DNA helicase